MRRYALLVPLFGPLLALPGCTGFGEFLSHTVSSPYSNPNLPMADSATLRRVLGQDPTITPLQPEPGNVWPKPQPPDPTLNDLQRGTTANNGAFAPTTVPGAEPGLPAGRQPRPRGSSAPPGSAQPEFSPGPSAIAPLPPFVGTRPAPQSPQGRVVQTPQGPAVDAGGTSGYRQLTTPQGPGAIMVPNGNGTSTIINPNGTVQTVPTPR